MRYSIEPRDAKNMLKTWVKRLSNKHGQKIRDSAKKSTTDAIEKIQKIAEVLGDLIGNKISGKITSVSKKKSAKELHNSDDDNETKEEEEDAEITTHKKRYISPEERQQITDELRLVPKTYA